MDPLEAFVNLNTGLVPPCPATGVNRVGGFVGLTMARQGPFQAQLWICPPNSTIPEHGHPNVDSLQVFLSGEMTFFVNGQQMPTRAGGAMRVRPGEKHSATIGANGGAFMTYQYWLNGEPQSVEMDWEGEPIDEGHRAVIVNTELKPGLQTVTGLRELKPSELHLCIEGGHLFTEEGKIDGAFNPEFFIEQWTRLIEAGVGVMIAAFTPEGEIAGAFGGFISKELKSGELTAYESIFYVLPRHRGKSRFGIKLIRYYEEWAKRKGAKRMRMGHLLSLQAEELGGFYRRLGYQPLEMQYVKSI